MIRNRRGLKEKRREEKSIELERNLIEMNLMYKKTNEINYLF